MFFESWVIFTLLATATYACSHIIDKVTLDKIFTSTEDWLIGICLTSILPAGTLLLFPQTTLDVSPLHAFLALASGGILFLSFYFYAASLKRTDVDVVSALLQFDPIYAVIIGVIFLNDSLSVLNLFGILIVVAMAFLVSFPLRKARMKASLKRTPFFYIQFSCLILVVSSAVVDHLLEQNYIMDVMFYYFTGTFLTGLAYFIVKRKDNGFIETIKQNKKQAIISLLVIQTTTAFALYFVFRAYELGSFTLVTALMATEPFIVMGIIYMFNKLKPGALQRFRKEDLRIKVPAYLGIFLGIHFLML